MKKAGNDPRLEYDRLYGLFYLHRIQYGLKKSITIEEICAENFLKISFRGTCISLKDFDDFYGFHFSEEPSDFDIDYLITFCEYTYNLIFGILAFVQSDLYPPIRQHIQLYIEQVMRVVEKMGYMENGYENVITFVPKDQAAISVAEILDSDLSYKVIEYNHHSMKGNLDRKRATLIALADKLEPHRDELSRVNKSLEDDLFCLLNNVNVRHNNTDPEGKNYRPYVASMTKNTIEQWYDDLYQMCLLAFMEMDQIERKDRISILKKNL